MQVIGSYKGDIRRAGVIPLRDRILALTQGMDLGVPNSGDSRSPDENHSVITRNRGVVSTDVRDWHQDGTQFHDFHLVLWANKYPTVVRDRLTLVELEAKNGDILLFDNETCEHRVPSITAEQAKERWLYRLTFGYEEARDRWDRKQPSGILDLGFIYEESQKPLDTARAFV